MSKPLNLKRPRKPQTMQIRTRLLVSDVTRLQSIVGLTENDTVSGFVREAVQEAIARRLEEMTQLQHGPTRFGSCHE